MSTSSVTPTSTTLVSTPSAPANNMWNGFTTIKDYIENVNPQDYKPEALKASYLLQEFKATQDLIRQCQIQDCKPENNDLCNRKCYIQFYIKNIVHKAYEKIEKPLTKCQEKIIQCESSRNCVTFGTDDKSFGNVTMECVEDGKFRKTGTVDLLNTCVINKCLGKNNKKDFDNCYHDCNWHNTDLEELNAKSSQSKSLTGEPKAKTMVFVALILSTFIV